MFGSMSTCMVEECSMICNFPSIGSMSMICDIHGYILLACMFTYSNHVLPPPHLRCGNGVQLLFHTLIRWKSRHGTR